MHVDDAETERQTAAPVRQKGHVFVETGLPDMKIATRLLSKRFFSIFYSGPKPKESNGTGARVWLGTDAPI